MFLTVMDKLNIMNLNSREIRRLNIKSLFNRRCVFGVVAVVAVVA